MIVIVIVLTVALLASMWMTSTYRSYWLEEVEKRRAAEASTWRLLSSDVPIHLRYRRQR